jgi:hypothetical protein
MRRFLPFLFFAGIGVAFPYAAIRGVNAATVLSPFLLIVTVIPAVFKLFRDQRFPPNDED